MLHKSIRIAVLLTSGMVGLSIPACGDGVGDQAGTGDAVLRGELAVYIADTFDGKSETSYYLRDAAGDEQRLFFSPSASRRCQPGTGDTAEGPRHAVRRRRRGQLVRGFRPTPSRGRPFAAHRRGALSAAQLRVRPRSTWGSGVNTTAATAMGRLIGDADSIRNYYLYDSYRTQDITAQVIGPIKYSLPTCSNTDTRNLATTLRAMVPGTFQHYLWYFGQQDERLRVGGAGFGGHAAVAGAATPGTTARRAAWCWCRSPGTTSGCSTRRRCAAGRRRRRRSEQLHGQRVRRPLRSDGGRLSPHERLAEGVSGLVRRLQRRARQLERDVHAAAARAVLQRHAVPAGQGPQDPHVQPPGGRAAAAPAPRRSTTTTSSCARRWTSTACSVTARR